MSIYHSNPEQVLFTSHGCTVELCISEESLKQTLKARSFFYQKSGRVSVPESGDEFDRAANAKVFAVIHSGQVIGTIRNLISSSQFDGLPCFLDTYAPQCMQALPMAQPTVLESSRFAISPNLDRRTAFQVQGILFRVQHICYLAEEVDFLTTFVHPSHSGFYRKYMWMKKYGQFFLSNIPHEFLAVPKGQDCTFSYSLPENLGINLEECVDRYRILKMVTPFSEMLQFQS